MSQLDPLPTDLPFRIISKTIGRGAYASIRKAIPLEAVSPVIAVKFIHKEYAVRYGRITQKQIAMEVSLHSHIGIHPNIIEWFASGEDAVWKWIAMEFAEGGDLFDKIEADVGVSEDIAHIYFKQLVNGIGFMQSKGVAHRDIKPENILLSESGNLKIADFGLATLFEHKGKKKFSTAMCGSPPYIAPEVLACANSTQSRMPPGSGYAADFVDIWSCGVVLFVLLVGNTPWDEPTSQSYEFMEYTRTNGRPDDVLWERLPPDALSLLRGMMTVDPKQRFTLEKIRWHPWYTRSNPLMTPDGSISDQLSLATLMLENLRIDFSQKPTASQRTARKSMDAMDIDASTSQWAVKYSMTQPEAPRNDVSYDWELPPRVGVRNKFSATQPTSARDAGEYTFATGRDRPLLQALVDEPTMSQFTTEPRVPLSLTQHAQKFHDIMPSYSLTRFFSHLSSAVLLQMIGDALLQLNIPVPPAPMMQGRESLAWIKVKTMDERRCCMTGDIIVDEYYQGEDELLEVRFVKVAGDPLEWRRFFKKVVILCKEGVYIPEA